MNSLPRAELMLIQRDSRCRRAVLDGEGIAVAAVEHLELPFEVDGPDRVGLIHGRERLAGVARFTRTPTLLRDQIVTLENVINRPTLRSWSPSNPSARNRVHHVYPAVLLMP